MSRHLKVSTSVDTLVVVLVLCISRKGKYISGKFKGIRETSSLKRGWGPGTEGDYMKVYGIEREKILKCIYRSMLLNLNYKPKKVKRTKTLNRTTYIIVKLTNHYTVTYLCGVKQVNGQSLQYLRKVKPW